MFLSVHYLRGLAALLVVFVHIEFQLKRLDYEYPWPRSLEGGVDIFFVISGFVIWTAATRHTGSIGDFALRRLARIAPLYWLTTSTIVIFSILMPRALQSIQFDLAHVLTSYLFIPFPSPKQGLMHPLLVAGWTLNYEMFFYVIFALTMAFSLRNRFFVLSTLIIGFVISGQVFKPKNLVLKYWSDPIILEFFFGVLAANVLNYFSATRMRAAFYLITAAILWFLFSMIFTDIHRAFALGVPAFFLILSVTTYERSNPIPVINVARMLGDSSYALYLTHGIVLSAALQFWLILGLDNYSPILFCGAAILLSLLVGHLTHIMVDHPLQQFLKRVGPIRRIKPVEP